MDYKNNDMYEEFEMEKSSEEFWSYLFKMAELLQEYIEEDELEG